jgi:hypothetical protein
MASQTLPKKPVENWEQVRDEWVAAVEGLVGQVEAWAVERGWAVRRESKTITEDHLGPYTVPRLMILAGFSRIILDPVARFVAGAGGLVDLATFPSYETFFIGRNPEGDGWFIQAGDVTGARQPWSKEAFLAALQSLQNAQ